MHSEITFRPAKRRDVDEIRRLHEEWFPVRYEEDFYNRIVSDCDDEESGFSSEENLNLIYKGEHSKNTISAKYPLCIVAALSLNELNNGLDYLKKIDSNSLYECGERTFFSNIKAAGRTNNVVIEEGEIIGCIVSTLLSSTKNPIVHDLLVKEKRKFPEVAYIMTLGIDEQYRRCGIGQSLVQICINEAMNNPMCGSIYLHVITYNDAAIQFYERLGFTRVTIIKGVY